MLADARSNNCQIVELLLDHLIMYHFHLLIYTEHQRMYIVVFFNLGQMVVLDMKSTTVCGDNDSLSNEA